MIVRFLCKLEHIIHIEKRMKELYAGKPLDSIATRQSHSVLKVTADRTTVRTSFGLTVRSAWWRVHTCIFVVQVPC